MYEASESVLLKQWMLTDYNALHKSSTKICIIGEKYSSHLCLAYVF